MKSTIVTILVAISFAVSEAILIVTLRVYHPQSSYITLYCADSYLETLLQWCRMAYDDDGHHCIGDASAWLDSALF